jgi:hypothetical protein
MKVECGEKMSGENKERVRKEECVGKVGKTLNFYEKQNDLTDTYFSDMPIIFLLYKKTYFNTNKLDSCIPSVCVSLLQEFEDVFPDEIPSGLPLISGIEHQINLILGSVIPNRLAYRSNPKETKELQRQVEELMSKGYIRESMSLCVVLVF